MKPIYLILLLFLISCGSSKKALKTEETETKQSNIAIADSTHTKEDKNTLEKMEENDSFEYVKIEYDTDKPVDKYTGLPPVKSVVTANKNKNTKKEKDTNESREEVKKTDAIINTEENKTIAVDAKEEKNPTNIVQDFTKLVWALVVLGICVAVWWLVKKGKKK